MELTTERLRMTLMILSDIEEIHQMNLYPEVAEFNTIGIPKDISETEKLQQPIIDDAHNEKRTKFAWTVRSKETAEFIGQIGMNIGVERFKLAEIYYSVLPKHWNKGYASEGVKRVISFGFDDMNLHRIQAGVATENHRSIKLLEKVGMQREGLKRKILPIRGEWKDNYHYAILEEDKRN